MVDVTSTQVQAGAAGAESSSRPPPLTVNGVPMMYHQLAGIHAIAAVQLAECAH
jgi:hypothetical protein